MSRHKGIRTLMLDTLDKQAERDTRHRKDAIRISKLEEQVETLKARLAEARKGLEAVREHHVFLNDKAYRPISQSHTITLCDAALGCWTRPCPPPSCCGRVPSEARSCWWPGWCAWPSTLRCGHDQPPP